MDNKKNRSKVENTNVEFGNEFGDINAAKAYEIPIMNSDKGKKSTKKK